jgi:DAK2 domain fusion protein YloV
MALYHEVLIAHRDELDSLNVFPVPDGDTGTNLLFTQRAVVAALAVLDPAERDDPLALAEAIAVAALRAARGNSGVILAAVLRPLAESLGTAAGSAAGSGLADAFEAADREAWRTVADPKDGTVLTVLREASSGARAAADAGAADDAAEVARRSLGSAARALEETTNQRPELARAGVVDAGALGLVLLIDCIHAALVDREPGISVGPYGPVGRKAMGSASVLDGGFEVQFVVHTDAPSVDRLRSELARVGTSLAISGSEDTYAVHLHTDEPERALAAGVAAGRVEGRAVRPFDARPDECAPGNGSITKAPVRTGLIAVADGSGLQRAFRSLGANVVMGGPAHNPPVGALEDGVESSGGRDVILLPNHPNVVPAAQAAIASAQGSAAVIDAPSIPAGLAAATAYRPDADFSDNVAEMSTAAAAVRAGEVTMAAIGVKTSVGPIRAGDWLASVGDTVVEIGDDPMPLARHLVERLISDANEPELITIVLGEGAPSPEVDPVCGALREMWPHLRVEVIVGGQPRHRYLIGVE